MQYPYGYVKYPWGYKCFPCESCAYAGRVGLQVLANKIVNTARFSSFVDAVTARAAGHVRSGGRDDPARRNVKRVGAKHVATPGDASIGSWPSDRLKQPPSPKTVGLKWTLFRRTATVSGSEIASHQGFCRAGGARTRDQRISERQFLRMTAVSCYIQCRNIFRPIRNPIGPAGSGYFPVIFDE